MGQLPMTIRFGGYSIYGKYK